MRLVWRDQAPVSLAESCPVSDAFGSSAEGYSEHPVSVRATLLERHTRLTEGERGRRVTQTVTLLLPVNSGIRPGDGIGTDALGYYRCVELKRVGGCLMVTAERNLE